MAVKNYIVGRGSAFVAKITNGVPGTFVPLSNLKSFSFALATEQGEHYETETVQSMLDASWTTKKSGKIDAELEDVNRSNAKILFAARVTEVAASTATAEVIAAALPEVGGILTLARGKATSVVIKDSTSGTAKTLTAGVNYALRDGGIFGSQRAGCDHWRPLRGTAQGRLQLRRPNPGDAAGGRRRRVRGAL